MTKTITMTYTVLHRYREKLFVLLVTGILILAASYVFLLQKAIVNVVAREKVVAEVNIKTTQVAGLEANYFTLKNSITLEMAHTKGFKDAAVTAYISKKSVTAMASHDEL